jgi:hypothetical protein
MITYANIKRFDDLDFMEYLRLPGFSHSFLKSERSGVAADILMTENIRIGKLVDGILTDPASVDMGDPLYSVAREVVYFIEKQFGKLIKHFEPQVSYSAEINFKGFTMLTKGRLDWLLKDIAVTDLKITRSKNIRSVIDFMGYKNQVYHYARLARVPKAYLMVHSIPLKKTELIKIDCSGNENEFWAEKIIHFGTAKQLIDD